MNREAIYSALFAKFQGIPDFVTCSRWLKHYDDVPPSEQPACFVAQGSQIAKKIKGFPTEYTLEAKVWLYAHNTDQRIPPSIALNNILDKVDEMLKPSHVEDHQTLGGIVEHCWIDGEIITDEGTLGDQSIAIFTIKILSTT